MPCRAVADRKPRKLRWKTTTYGPLVRPYHPYKEVGSSFSKKGRQAPPNRAVGATDDVPSSHVFLLLVAGGRVHFYLYLDLLS